MNPPRVFTYRVPSDPTGLDDRILSPDEAMYGKSFRAERDRVRYMARHIVLRRLLGGVLGIAPRRVPISRDPCRACGRAHGKPVLPSELDVHFSLAHTGDLVFFSVHDRPNGVDVETIGPRDVWENLRIAALTAAEAEALRRLPAAIRNAQAIQCWVRKEALLKGTGEGLIRDPRLVHVGVGARPGQELCPDTVVEGFRLINLASEPGTAAALAIAGTTPVASVGVIRLGDEF